MNGAHIHLLLNHFPMIGLVFSSLILGLGLLIKNQGFIRSGLLVTCLSGALALPTYLSGEPAEKTIENSPSFSEARVEEHEDAAAYAVWALGLTAVVAAAGLTLSIQKSRVPKPLMISIVVLHIFSLVVIGRTNNLGGQISHPEIRGSSAQAPTSDGHE